MMAGEAAVEVLRAEGVKYIFGLPGAHTLRLYDVLHRCPEIQHVLVRHEQAAANMAGAYAQLTGEPGICTATAGPGATNLVTGVAEAYKGALPVIVLTGRTSTATQHRGAGQDIDQDAVFTPITKWAVRVDRADLLVPVLRQAFVIARSGKPGPVLVDIPIDLQDQEVVFEDYRPAGKPPAPRAAASVVSEVAERLVASDRPLIIAGGGALMGGAAAELRRLAEMMAMPVLTTLSGRGVFPDDHPLAGGGLGVHRNPVSRDLLQTADFVLGLGCRFEEMETNWCPGFLPPGGSCYVQVDTDPIELGRSVIPTIGAVSDARLFVADLLEELKDRRAPDQTAGLDAVPRVLEMTEKKRQLEEQIRPWLTSEDVPLDPVRVIGEIRQVFGTDASAAIDIGLTTQGFGGAFPYFKTTRVRSLIVPTSFYAMGFAASALPIAKLVHPDYPAVGLCGDGTFQMVMNVLPVAAELGLAVTWCVFNNEGYASLRNLQEGWLQGRFIATGFSTQPDFARIAEACGCYGEKVLDPQQIGPALERALAANTAGRPAVLDFLVAEKKSQAACEFEDDIFR